VSPCRGGLESSEVEPDLVTTWLDLVNTKPHQVAHLGCETEEPGPHDDKVVLGEGHRDPVSTGGVGEGSLVDAVIVAMGCSGCRDGEQVGVWCTRRCSNGP
jgi:hypothetical protein